MSPPPPTQELAHVEEKKEELLPPTKTEDVGKKRASEIVADEVSHLSYNWEREREGERERESERERERERERRELMTILVVHSFLFTVHCCEE